MSDYDGHPAVEALRSKKRPEPGDGQAICPDCDGFGMVRTPGYVEACQRCLGEGVLPLCACCGSPLKQRYRRCECEAASDLLSAEAESCMRCRWASSAPAPFALPCYSDRTGTMYYAEDLLVEAWRERRGEPEKLPPIDPEWALLYALSLIHI